MTIFSLHLPMFLYGKQFSMNERSDRPAKKRAVKITEAAEMLSVSPISIRRAIDRSLIKTVRIFRHVLVPISEIERLLADAQ